MNWIYVKIKMKLIKDISFALKIQPKHTDEKGLEHFHDLSEFFQIFLNLTATESSSTNEK